MGGRSPRFENSYILGLKYIQKNIHLINLKN